MSVCNVTKIYYIKKRKVAFTLTELTIALILLFAVGFIVTKEAYNDAQRKIDAQKVQLTYELLEKAAQVWQNENNCNNDIRYCIQMAKQQAIPDKEIFNGIAKYLPVIDANVSLNAKGRQIKGQKFVDIDWLPEYSKNYDGSIQSSSMVGVSKFYDINTKKLTFYKLRDGVTIMVNLSNYDSDTGYGFFDINGIEGKNKIGVDIFPFSLGANINEYNSFYDKAAKKFNPYFSSDNYDGFDLCNINYGTCDDEKTISNPTVYVLAKNKLPR